MVSASTAHVPNGPNLLGRQPEIPGRETLADGRAECRRIGADLSLAVRFQSRREYEPIGWVHEAREDAAGIVINPAIFPHTPNVRQRESFRHRSCVPLVAAGAIARFGAQGYTLAPAHLARLMEERIP